MPRMEGKTEGMFYSVSEFDGLTSDCDVKDKEKPKADIGRFLKSPNANEAPERRKKKLRKERKREDAVSASMTEDSAMETENIIAGVSARKRKSEKKKASSSSEATEAKKVAPSAVSGVVVESVEGRPVVAAVVKSAAEGSPAKMGPPKAVPAVRTKVLTARQPAGGPSSKATTSTAAIAAAAARKAAVPVAPMKGVAAPMGAGGGSNDGLNLTGILKRCSDIKGEVLGLIASSPEVAARVCGITAKYEALILELSGVNERLRGRLEGVVRQGVGVVVGNGPSKEVKSLGVPVGLDVAVRPSWSQMAQMAAADGVSAGLGGDAWGVKTPDVAPAKSVETYSVVLKGKNNESVEVVKKRVVEELVPAVGVRVHTVHPAKHGAGVLVRTPTAAERDAIIGHKKLDEVGLSAEAKRGRRIVVRGMERRITPVEFLDELRRLNLSELTDEQFRSGVRLCTPWKAGDGRLNAVLECSDEIAGQLLKDGWCYIKHFAFVVREKALVEWCSRCLGLDHFVARCRQKESVCWRCGKSGHSKSNCGNEIHCRDCDFKVLPAGHYMLSMDCPVYTKALERAKARH